MKEELKQAIQHEVSMKIKEIGDFFTDEDSIKLGAVIALSTPSILRHADPEIMKAAGWVSSEWISVEDRLPDIGERVLVYTDLGRTVICFLHAKYKWNVFSHNNGVESPTHWKPLPQPPKQ